MNINVGSKNPIKVSAVREAVLLYPKLFHKPTVVGIDVPVELFGHPKNLRETVKGAIQRAKDACTDCSYSFGIEGGLMKVPYTKTGYMETGVCAIFDGRDISLGLSPCYEWPGRVTDLILSNEADASQAFKRLKITEHEKLGAVPGGIVGYLTNHRLTREEYVKYSIIMALIHLEKHDLYNSTMYSSLLSQ